jgi:hypothetical protein
VSETDTRWQYGSNKSQHRFSDLERMFRDKVEFTEKNIRTDLDAMQEMVEINKQPTPSTIIDGEVLKGFDKERISEKLGL